MTTLARLVVKLITDVSEFEAGMKNAAKKLDKIGQGMAKTGDMLSAGITLPLLAAGGASIKFASDLAENMNKANVVFGESAAEVTAWSKTTADALGMSQSAALDAAGKLGSLFVTMGMGTDEAADMSMTLTQLAADLGSFYNISGDEALEKLRSGLVGEAEPLRSVGVLINDAAVKAKAMEMGLGDATGALTEQEKVLARYALIMEQTTIAQGDFANTSDGLANSIKRAGALWTDTMASFGEVLIPTAISFMQAAIPILEFFNGLPQPVKQGIIYVLAFAAALGPVLSIGGRLISLFAGIKGAFAAGGALATIGTWFTGTLLPALGSVPAAAGAAGAALGAIALPAIALGLAIGTLVIVIKAFGKDAVNTVKMIGQIFAKLPELIALKAREIGPAIAGAIRDAANWISARANDLYRAGQNLMVGLINGITSYAVYVVQVVMRVVDSVINAVKRMLGIRSPSKVFAMVGENMMRGMERGISEFSSKPITATVQAAEGTVQAAAAIQPAGGGRSISVGPITINGDLSASQKEKLKVELQSMFVGVLAEALA